MTALSPVVGTIARAQKWQRSFYFPVSSILEYILLFFKFLKLTKLVLALGLWQMP